jgi:membrane-associated phospholipid phosphatase
MAPAVNNIWIDEIMHAFYFSYYLILFLPAVWLRQQRIPQAFEIVFSLVLMLYVHFLFFMVFPSDGPIPERSHIFGRGIVFIPLMNFIYQASEQGGGGAFPSTHVSAAVLVFLYTFRYAPKLRLPVGLSCAGVILATVYCSYHYAIDSVAGWQPERCFSLLVSMFMPACGIRWSQRPHRSAKCINKYILWEFLMKHTLFGIRWIILLFSFSVFTYAGQRAMQIDDL